MSVSNARELDNQDHEIARLEHELDSALSSLVDAEDRIDALTEQRDTARRIAVACENDERRGRAEADESIRLLLKRDADRLMEIDSLTRRNQELELMLASRPAS